MQTINESIEILFGKPLTEQDCKSFYKLNEVIEKLQQAPTILANRRPSKHVS